MSLYRTVSPAEATGKVKEVYDDIMGPKKLIPFPISVRPYPTIRTISKPPGKS